jgi:hypothetical protein
MVVIVVGVNVVYCDWYTREIKFKQHRYRGTHYRPYDYEIGE